MGNSGICLNRDRTHKNTLFLYLIPQAFHVSLLQKLLGNAIVGATIEKGLGGAAPGEIAPYEAIGNLYFESMESFQNSFGPNAPAIMGDLPNFTDIEPIVQIAEVIL